MKTETWKTGLIGAAWVVGIFSGLIGILSLVTGRSPSGDGSERRSYRTVDGRELAMWVYRPKNWAEADRRPAVLWFFGGGFEVGVPSQFAKQAETLARRGVMAMTVDYRVRSRHGKEVTPFDSVDDARAALAWVRDHAKELGIDPGRIAVAGGSSGGLLAAMCAIPSGGEGKRLPMELPGALILLNPAVDLDIPVVRERTGEKERESLVRITPIQQLKGPLPPTVILHGSEDAIVPLSGSEAFVEKAKSLGSQRIDLVSFPGRGHEFYLHGFQGNQDFEASMKEVIEFLNELGWIGN